MVRLNDEERIKRLDNKFYKIMVEYLGEEIFVTDGKGKVIFVNPASAKTIGMAVDEIIGLNAADFEEQGYFKPSCTLEVIRQRKQVNLLQQLKNGRTVLATGVPIFDNEHENIIMVISTSKDVEAVNQLLKTVEEQSGELEQKTEELNFLRQEIFTEQGFISSDPVMIKVKDTLMKVAPLDLAVLIEGETGVGKEVFVRALHRFSERKDGPLIKINCGIIPENLMESEIFGYEEGAFTGAQKSGKKGKVELANGGTLFLDEIGELPLSLQVKLLDLLQDGTFTRVGGNQKIRVDARIVAATNRDLKAMSEKGTFREDLFYRLNVFPVIIPPLRDRKQDIETLTKYFIVQYNSKYKRHKRITDEACGRLLSYDWPGNVRELEHVLERAFILTEEDDIGEEVLKNCLYGNAKNTEGARIICTDIMPLKEAKSEVERQLLTRAYDEYKSTYKVADVLKIDQSTVVKLLHKHR